MRPLLGHIIRTAALGVAGVAACASIASADDERHGDRDFDRVIVIVMENHGFDNVIGGLDPRDPSGTKLVTPFITQLALNSGLGTYYFGLTHPSLPNYLSMIAGDFFGVHDDNDSCFNPAHGANCHGFDVPNLVDQLEARHISWESLNQTMPSVGFLGSRFPTTGPTLYAQKHNPFVYFKDIALDPSRLAKIKPFDLGQLQAELASPATASRFIYLVPDQCNDQHGTTGCNADDATILANGDAFLAKTVPVIVGSRAFTEKSVLFIVWDEDDFGSNLSCCGEPGIGGGHVAMIAVTKGGSPVKNAAPTNHFSLLATIEDGFGLPRLANAKTANTLFGAIPVDHGE